MSGRFKNIRKRDLCEQVMALHTAGEALCSQASHAWLAAHQDVTPETFGSLPEPDRLLHAAVLNWTAVRTEVAEVINAHLEENE